MAVMLRCIPDGVVSITCLKNARRYLHGTNSSTNVAAAVAGKPPPRLATTARRGDSSISMPPPVHQHVSAPRCAKKALKHLRNATGMHALPCRNAGVAALAEFVACVLVMSTYASTKLTYLI